MSIFDIYLYIKYQKFEQRLGKSTWGSNGNSDILLPKDVRFPSSSSAARKFKASRARINVSGAGASTQSNRTRSLTPAFTSSRTVLPKLHLKISGWVCSSSSLMKSFSVNSRKHFPGRVRPARPARCCADAFEIGVTSRDSTRIRGLYNFCLEKPGSTTYTIPSMVRDVSATFVDTMTFRPGGPPGIRGGGAGSNICCCC